VKQHSHATDLTSSKMTSTFRFEDFMPRLGTIIWPCTDSSGFPHDLHVLEPENSPRNEVSCSRRDGLTWSLHAARNIVDSCSFEDSFQHRESSEYHRTNPPSWVCTGWCADAHAPEQAVPKDDGALTPPWTHRRQTAASCHHAPTCTFPCMSRKYILILQPEGCRNLSHRVMTPR
jgi:hypothetical protein